MNHIDDAAIGGFGVESEDLEDDGTQYKTLLVSLSHTVGSITGMGRLGKKVSKACNQLHDEGYEIMSICSVGTGSSPHVLVTGVLRD